MKKNCTNCMFSSDVNITINGTTNKVLCCIKHPPHTIVVDNHITATFPPVNDEILCYEYLKRFTEPEGANHEQT